MFLLVLFLFSFSPHPGEFLTFSASLWLADADFLPISDLALFPRDGQRRSSSFTKDSGKLTPLFLSLPFLLTHPLSMLRRQGFILLLGEILTGF